MKKFANKELLQIRQCITILSFEAYRVVKLLGMQSPEALKIYRSLNLAIVQKLKIEKSVFWIRETKNITKIPKNRDVLLKCITELRYRLNTIAAIYGYRSSTTLRYSQHLDKFIVAFQLSMQNDDKTADKK